MSPLNPDAEIERRAEKNVMRNGMAHGRTVPFMALRKWENGIMLFN